MKILNQAEIQMTSGAMSENTMGVIGGSCLLISVVAPLYISIPAGAIALLSVGCYLGYIPDPFSTSSNEVV